MPQRTVDIPPRMPFVVQPDNRAYSANKDARLINGYLEKDPEGNYRLFKRPGLAVDTTLSGNGYGVYNWNGVVYSIFGTSIYKNGVLHGTVDGTGGVYRFSETQGATPYLLLGNGVKGYYTDGTTLTQMTGGAFPSAFFKGWAYLDKTTYLMSTPNAINGSGLDDPTTWDALNVINAWNKPDKGIGLAQQLVYVIAFKQYNTEVFYDAQNATGSPLLPLPNSKLDWGCVTIESQQEVDGILLWVANNRVAGSQVIMMDNLKPIVISTPAIERLLDEANFSTTYSWVFKDAGHTFYGLTVTSLNITLVYDLREHLWYQWTDTNGNYFPIVAATFGANQTHILQHATDGKLYTIDSSNTNDAGSVIPVDLYTKNIDLGTSRTKQCNVLTFIGDQTPGSVLQIRSNDNDYDSTKWSNFRTVDMSIREPILTGEGSFVRRAYNIRHRSNTRLRLEGVDMQIALGVL